MAKVVANRFALDMSTYDVADVFDPDPGAWTPTYWRGSQVLLDGPPGYTAEVLGKHMDDPDLDYRPDEGVIKKIQIFYEGKPVYTLSGIEFDTAVFRAHGDIEDIEGLNQLLFGGKDQIFGSALGDTLLGYDGDDIIEGGKGGDAVQGDAGDDQLIGGRGLDYLTGGEGDDVFKFKDLFDSGNKSPKADLIVDLEAGDVIDLRNIDANAGKDGNNTFKFVDAFTGAAGEATLKHQGGSDRTILSLDVDGDAKADMVIVIQGDHADHTGFVL